MRKLIVGLLIVAAAIGYLAIEALELRGRLGEFQVFFWLIVGTIELPILVMLALQFATNSRRAVAATAAIALVGFAGLLPFFAFIILLSVMDFMNDGLRWGLLCLLVVLVFAIGLICRRSYREEPAEGARNVWRAPIALSTVYVVLAYVILYSYAASKVAERALQ